MILLQDSLLIMVLENVDELTEVVVVAFDLIETKVVDEKQISGVN